MAANIDTLKEIAENRSLPMAVRREAWRAFNRACRPSQDSDLHNELSYNGWSNYETWAVNLWLSNDEGLYNATQEIVQHGLTYADDHPNVPSIWTQEEANRFAVADALKTWVVDDLAPDLGATFAADLLGSALSEVDWEEIADALLEDVSAEVDC